MARRMSSWLGRDGLAGWLCQLAMIRRPSARAALRAANCSAGSKEKCSGLWSALVMGECSTARSASSAVPKRYPQLSFGSPTFGKHVAVELSGENHREFFIPRGFAHGFAVLSDTALFQYKCDNPYCPESEGAIAFDDPALGIDWRIPTGKALLSDKDRKHKPLAEADGLFDYNEKLY